MHCNYECSYYSKINQTIRKRWIKELIAKPKEYTHLNILNEIKLYGGYSETRTNKIRIRTKNSTYKTFIFLYEIPI